ncbi:MsnO8 family LLM class oxidoreductase [Streptomyces sp. NPDC005423]|uniref:MsnO8 family LLM class oxidoreductase n=1 Tax=Streptomyces sp. NPDC005423 TaxID=3155343 RepID=UPI0033AA306F
MVVSGPVGVGKSAFAVHVAHLLADTFPDGLIMTELGNRPLGSVLRALLDSVGLPGPQNVGQALARWRAWVADRRILLVLDDAVGQQTALALLPGSGASCTVVTSRYRLSGLAAVARVELAPFREAEATELLGRVVGFGRVMSEQFAVLQSLHEDRIDLGVGRATGGTDSGTLLDRALRRPPQARAEFPQLLDELVGFLYGRWPGGHAFEDLELSPALPVPPGVFVLGTSENGARVAAARGLPFAYGAHLGPKSRPASLDRYRSAFAPGPLGASPYVIASVNVQCAETDAEAERLAHDTAAARFRQKPTATFPEAALPEPRERYLIGRMMDDLRLVHGGPATVAAGLLRLAASLGADEIMLVPYDITAADRARTLRLTAAAWPSPPERGRSRAADREGRPAVS